MQRQESEKEIEIQTNNKNNKKGKKKAHCVMSFHSFGGKRGEILTFTSYAQKMVIKNLHFVD